MRLFKKFSPARLALVSLTTIVVTAFGTAGAYADTAGAPPGTPTATQSAGSPIVGALFPPGSADHACTGTVISSPAGDLVMTAAHCVSGTVAGWTFAPDWSQGSTPEGVWTVTAAYALHGWRTNGNTQQDVAVLKVAPQQINGRWRNLQSVTGAATVGWAPQNGQQIDDIAYNDGAQTAVSCTVPTYWTAGYPSFNCHGYVNGSSGSPWLVWHGNKESVVGVIGGLHQGGCYEYTSYSSAFGWDVQRLIQRATWSRKGDVLPVAGSDGC